MPIPLFNWRRRVYLFGSLLNQDFREYSDIDFAVAGLPLEHVYKVEAEIEVILAGMPFDLVYLETAPSYLAARIRERKTLCLPYSLMCTMNSRKLPVNAPS